MNLSTISLDILEGETQLYYKDTVITEGYLLGICRDGIQVSISTYRAFLEDVSKFQIPLSQLIQKVKDRQDYVGLMVWGSDGIMYVEPMVWYPTLPQALARTRQETAVVLWSVKNCNVMALL